MNKYSTNAPTAAEKALEIARWKATPSQSEEAKAKQKEYFRLLEARKAPETPDKPLYVSSVTGKAFRADGSFR